MIIAHLDLDAFFAAVEQLDDVGLRGRPVVVGGDEQGRGVVATASYEARAYGIRSAMSAAQARRRCPDAVFVRTRMDRYREVSAQVWQLVRSRIPIVEQVGIDEGYLDVSLAGAGTDFAMARGLMIDLQQALEQQIGITCSIGLANSKVVAKIASDRHKPAGLTAVRPGSERAFLAPLAIDCMPGIGPRSAEILRAYGIDTLGKLADLSDDDLARLWPGKHGLHARARARGIDERPVLSEPAQRKQVGHEHTFSRDIESLDALHQELRQIAQMTAERLQKSRRAAHTVNVKIRYSDFSTHTKSRTLSREFDDADTILTLAGELLDELIQQREASVRLLGVSVSKLVDHLQLPLLSDDVNRLDAQ